MPQRRRDRRAAPAVASSEVRALAHGGCLGAQPLEQRRCRALPGVARARGLEDERHPRRSPGGRSSSANASVPMWPSPMRWCRSLNAPRTSIESLACTSRSRPGPPISTIRSTVAVGAAGLVERRAGGEDVAGVEADPGLGVVVERGEVRREVLDAGAQRPALAGGRLEQQPRRGVVGDRVEQRQQPLADLAHRGVVPLRRCRSGRRTSRCARPRPRRRSRRPGGGCGRPMATDFSYVAAVGRAEVHEVRRVDERPGCPRSAQASRNARVLGRACPARQRPAARVADEDLERLAADARRRSRAPRRPVPCRP